VLEPKVAYGVIPHLLRIEPAIRFDDGSVRVNCFEQRLEERIEKRDSTVEETIAECVVP
jgi:hypothetical protein